MKPGPELDERLRELLSELTEAPLDSRDTRYVPLDAGGLAVRSPRRNPRATLQDTIELAEGPTCQLFSGFRGTGKSTELNRLRADLEAAGYVVLLADASEYLSLQRDLSPHELLFAVAGAFGAATAELLHENSLASSPWQRLHAWLTKDVQFKLAAKLGPLELSSALVGDDAFLDQLGGVMAGRVDALAAQVHQFIAECTARLMKRSQSARGVVFILDSLEKLSGPEPTFVARMESAVHTFASGVRHLRLPDCHTIYAVPLYFERLYPELPDHYDGPLRVLPTVKVYQRPDRAPFQPGIDGLRDVLSARVPLGEVFGSDQQVVDLILASGGHLRALLLLVRELIKAARRSGLPVEDTAVRRGLDEFAEDQQAAVRADAAPMLDGIRESFSIDQVGTLELPLLAHYLDSRLVLCYRNGDGWYDVHPAIREHVQRLAAAAREDAQPDGD